ncbi:MAG TPA: hypothetical protein VH641_17270 [Streptosporangiaceae bacterium]|jgi:hypothetical protein
MARRLSATGAVLAIVGGSVALAAPAAANAATSLPRACTVTAGKTSNLALSGNGVHPTGGTIFTKKAGSSCADLNLTAVGATDSYEGWLFNSHTDKWSACSRGFVRINKGSGFDVVLCSGVLAGTQMAVVQESATQRSITAEY